MWNPNKVYSRKRVLDFIVVLQFLSTKTGNYSAHSASQSCGNYNYTLTHTNTYTHTHKHTHICVDNFVLEI